MLIGRDDINNETISLGMCFSMFVYTKCASLALISASR